MDYHCSKKFTDLLINVQARQLQNCCKAWPERADLDWMEKNPGKIFHTQTMLEDRGLMLENKPCHSCHYGCYKYEEQGLTSARQTQQNSFKKDQPQDPLRSLQISLSTDCNLTCMYCSSQFSTSWHKDIQKNGPYNLQGQTIGNNNWTNLWAKTKQKQRSTESRFFGLVLKEIKLAKHLEEVYIQGGEPLLNNDLFRLLDALANHDVAIRIVTGLGIGSDRLKNFLDKITHMKNVSFDVSAEATGSFFEMIRYGIRWQDFKEMVNMITDRGFRVQFTSTLSNISIFDFHNFIEFYSNHEIDINPINDRNFLLPHVLDNESKNVFLKNIEKFGPHANIIKKFLEPSPSKHEIDNLGLFLNEFARRRSIDLTILPKNFIEWCAGKVD